MTKRVIAMLSLTLLASAVLAGSSGADNIRAFKERNRAAQAVMPGPQAARRVDMTPLAHPPGEKSQADAGEAMRANRRDYKGK